MKKKGIFNEYKGQLRKEIQIYCKENGIGENEFHFLSIYGWEDVYIKIMLSFGEYKYVSRNGLHWMNTNCAYNREITYSFCSADQWEWILKLPEMVGNEEMIYLVLEERGQRSKFWIAEGKPAVIAHLLNEGFFESDYYIVDKKFQWMIAREHHCCVHFIGDGFQYDFTKLEETGQMN